MSLSHELVGRLVVSEVGECLGALHEMMMMLNPHRISSGVRVSFSHLGFKVDEIL